MDVSWWHMVESTPTLLKKPLFVKNPQKFFQELRQEYHGKNVRDVDGNNLAHLCILYGCYEYLSEVPHLLDSKNKQDITPRELLQHLYITADVELKKPSSGSFYVYKKQEERFAYLSQEESKKHFQIDYLDRLLFKESKYLVWTLKRCKKKLLDPALKRRNQWVDSLYGNSFLGKTLPTTYIRWISPLIGYGLFAGEDIPRYSLIGEYTGVVRKRRYKLDKYNDYIFGYITADADTPFVIDAQHQGNHTRFVNHSDDPNLYSTWLIVKNICHVILVTKQAIPKHTQLTYDYGPTYWKKRSDPLLLK